MQSNQEKYDSALLGIIQNEGDIGKFLDVVYGFLYRKTDYYMVMKEKTAKMGFPPGVAMKLSCKAFQKYEEMAKKREEIRNQTINSTDKPVTKVDNNAITPKRDEQSTTSGKITESKKGDLKNNDISDLTQKRVSNEEESCSKAEDANVSSTAESTKGDNGEKDDDPELTKMQKEFQKNPASYNGAVRDTYSWSQSINDVDIQVKVPPTIRKGADVKVEIERKRLKVSHKSEDGNMMDIIDSSLTWEILKEESMWSLVPGEHVHINLEKVQERWWEAVLENEPKISVRKIDPSRPMEDLDDEAQAKIEEMMFNEHQKRLGKPQTHERKVHDILKQAWDAEGSPFKGQEFDPSVVKVANQGPF